MTERCVLTLGCQNPALVVLSKLENVMDRRAGCHACVTRFLQRLKGDIPITPAEGVFMFRPGRYDHAFAFHDAPFVLGERPRAYADKEGFIHTTPGPDRVDVGEVLSIDSDGVMRARIGFAARFNDPWKQLHEQPPVPGKS